MDLTREEIDEWWNSKATTEIIRHLKDQRQELLVFLGFGGGVGETPEQTGATTERIVGKVEGLSYIIEKEFVPNGD